MRNFDYLKNVPVELVVDPEAIRLFDLSTEPEEPAVATDVYDGTTWLSDGWKVSRFLKTALHATTAHFPLLTERQWMMILNTAMPTPFFEEDLVAGEIHRLAASIAESYGISDTQNVDLNAVANLMPAELMAVSLAVNRCWDLSKNWTSLRQVLSDTSGRPEESVFSDDPDIDDLWEVREVSIDGNKFVVDLYYQGGETATCHIELLSSHEFVLRNIELSSKRPLVPPLERKEGYLFGLAAPHIYEKLDEMNGELADAT